MSTRRFNIAREKASPFKQDLSPEAAKAKAERDLAAANTTEREVKRAENQRVRRAAIKAGTNISGKDYDHKDRKFKNISANRGNDGQGTKIEG